MTTHLADWRYAQPLARAAVGLREAVAVVEHPNTPEAMEAVDALLTRLNELYGYDLELCASITELCAARQHDLSGQGRGS